VTLHRDRRKKMATLRAPLLSVLTIWSALSSSAPAWAQSCQGDGWVEKHIRSRSSHAIAYDSARGVTVLFGGFDGRNSIADTWEYDGSGSGRETRHRRIPSVRVRA
jgi:hypothetical protein